MSANSFGHIFKMTSFGESHGDSMGVVIEGVPSGLKVDLNLLHQFLERRRPGQSEVVTSRNEDDLPKVLSGVFEGKTLGTPIAITIKNKDQKSEDYKNLPERKGHADKTWKQKYNHSDPRGGGRSSGRETVSRVIAGAFAKMLCLELLKNIKVEAMTQKMGPIEDLELMGGLPTQTGFSDNDLNEEAMEMLLEAKADGKSYGGIAFCRLSGVKSGLGQPVFKKLKAELASAIMSIGAVNGFEIGDGFEASYKEGSEYHSKNRGQYGGVQGGISTGDDITFRVSFKPTSSVLNVAKQGRHDPCIIPRALVVIESMVWMVLADHLLWSRLDNL